jgi:Ca2+-binding EF-hand superfamily protein
MACLNYAVLETIDRRNGQTFELIYVYEQAENKDQDLIEAKKTGQARQFKWSIRREDYEEMAKIGVKNALPFDSFVSVLRPFMMGTYSPDSIKEAFSILDRDESGRIDIDELTVFIPFIQPSLTKDIVARYIELVDTNNDRQLNLDEFTNLITRGIGREIISHLK